MNERTLACETIQREQHKQINDVIDFGVHSHETKTEMSM